MPKQQTPAGYNDAEKAAELLARSINKTFDGKAINKNRVLAAMREFGWLYVNFGEQKGSNHNQPRLEYTRNGFLAAQDRSYFLRSDTHKILKPFRVVLISAAALKVLQTYFETGNPPTPAVGTRQNLKSAESAKKPEKKASPDNPARKSILDQLRA